MEVSYSKSIEVRYDVDVFVAGGGPAGVAAAVSAARLGKKVLLAESFPAFGGAAVTMLVPAFMTFTDGEHFLAAGIGKEVYDRIKEEVPERFKAYCPHSIPVETLKLIYDDMVQTSGAKFLFYTSVIDAHTENGRIDYVVCSEKGGMFAVKADVYIDCTGDGELCCFAGAKSEYGDENGRSMATTLCGIWSGVEWNRVYGHDKRKLEEAFKDGVFTNEDRHLPGMWRLAAQSAEGVPDGVGGSNVGHVYGIDPRSSQSLTGGIVTGRKQLLEYRKYYREYLDGFENTELVFSAPYLGVREGRRIICDYRLTLDDFVKRAVFEDEIGRYSYPVDIHSPTNDKAGYEKFAKDHANLRYGKGESYGIPYRTLAVKGIDNLLTAGRSICTDRYMQSSVRVMPGCYITGQAAGTAAAVACDTGKNVHTVCVKEVQRLLKENGAYLPNYKD